MTRLIVRTAISAILLAVFLLPLLAGFDWPLMQRLENYAYDARVMATMPGTIDDRIVIVDVDEKSMAEEGQWPWPRNRLGRLVEQLFDRYGVKAVGFDMTFPEPDRRGGAFVVESLNEILDEEARQTLAEPLRELERRVDTDAQFARAIEGRNVITGMVFRDKAALDAQSTTGMLPEPVLTAGEVPRGLAIIEAAGFTSNLEIIQEAAAGGGFFNNETVDADNSFRRVPLLHEYKGDLYGSLALEVYRSINDWPRLALKVVEGAGGYRELEGVEIGRRSVPTGLDSSLLVPYRGTQGSFPYVSASDVIRGRAETSILEDRTVLVGTSAAGLLDLRQTPVGNKYPGVEVHANILSGLLDGRIKQQPEYVRAIHIALLLLIALVLTPLVSGEAVVWPTFWMLVVAGGTFGLNLALWVYGDFVVPLASPLLFTALLFGVHMLYGFFIESRGKRQLSKLFGQYVPPELVEEMDEAPEDFGLEGESREMTVLFSDVRGFTGISEGLEPRELTSLMNEFLTPITRVIHDNRGTIDKYMGDAVMAFWGAPLHDPDHANHAVTAALKMTAALERLQPEFEKRGWPAIRVGVGLNTGVMSVGNMGSEFRMAYTVMGDAVNLGSRLEGLTKQYGVEIVASEFTREAAPDFVYRELDLVRVKGREEPVAIYEPICRRDDLDKGTKQILTRHRSALRLYRSQQWDRAEREFFLLKQSDRGRPVYDLYLERIAHFRENPPGRNWDGVFVYTTK